MTIKEMSDAIGLDKKGDTYLRRCESEKEVIDRILNCEDNYIKESFIKFQHATKTYSSDVPVNDKYCISVKGKRRYIVPLVKNGEKVERINN